MRYSFYTADVFSNQIFGGNPLAVFPHAQTLTDGQMQKIAAEINYSETVFVLPPQTPDGTKQLRIFTPKAELPFAGHPTVGTAYVLANLGEIALTDPETRIIFEEGVGPVPVQILSHQGKPSYTELTASQLPEFGPEPPPMEQLAAMLSLNAEDLLAGEYAPQAVSCGLPFLFIPLKNQQALAQARLQRDRWQDLLSNFWANCVYLFTLETSNPAIFLRARMFAPSLGIEEDPATGSAAAALGGYLGIRDRREGTLQWQVEQGIEMGRPSVLNVKIIKTADQIEQVCVGGNSVMVMEGMIEVPS